MLRNSRIHPRTHHRGPPLSQHFLRDPALARALVASSHLPHEHPVFDIGAGTGMLTAAAADAGFRVHAVEKDVRLFRALRARFTGRTNVECHHADFLAMPIVPAPHTVVSNVPYAITSALLRRIIESGATDACLILQREAAQKLSGRPATSLLSLLHAPWWEIDLVRALDRHDFSPSPSVESVVLRMHRRALPLVASSDAAAYRGFVRSAFGTRRQKAREALRLIFTERQTVRLMRDLRIDRDARPSGITFPQWLALFRFHAHGRLAAAPWHGYWNGSRCPGRISSLVPPQATVRTTQGEGGPHRGTRRCVEQRSRR